MAPGRGLPVYQPATAVLAGTCSAPEAVRPSLIRRVRTPIAGMSSAVGARHRDWRGCWRRSPVALRYRHERRGAQRRGRPGRVASPGEPGRGPAHRDDPENRGERGPRPANQPGAGGMPAVGTPPAPELRPHGSAGMQGGPASPAELDNANHCSGQASQAALPPTAAAERPAGERYHPGRCVPRRPGPPCCPRRPAGRRWPACPARPARRACG